jgi:hypothetical protein
MTYSESISNRHQGRRAQPEAPMSDPLNRVAGAGGRRYLHDLHPPAVLASGTISAPRTIPYAIKLGVAFSLNHYSTGDALLELGKRNVRWVRLRILGSPAERAEEAPGAQRVTREGLCSGSRCNVLVFPEAVGTSIRSQSRRCRDPCSGQEHDLSVVGKVERRGKVHGPEHTR